MRTLAQQGDVAPRPGHCGETKNCAMKKFCGPNDCINGSSGVFDNNLKHPASTLADCANLCARCPRCKHVSFSRHPSRGCAWFAHCAALKPPPPEALDMTTLAVSGPPYSHSDLSCGPNAPPPRVAFVLAGQPRTFMTDPSVRRSFVERVVEDFRAGKGSHIFLHFKSVSTHEIGKVTRGSMPHPATVWGAERERKPLPPAHPECFEFDIMPRSRPALWWSAMQTGLEMVQRHEMRTSSSFDTVFFARPDIRYWTGWGPWCHYHPDVWYTGGERVSPDHLWVLPRRAADLVLGTYDVVRQCAPSLQCCGVRVGSSWWPLRYWELRGLNLSARVPGYGVVQSASHPAPLLVGMGN